MKILLAYIYVAHGRHSQKFAERFSETYLRYPAGIDHELVIVVNDYLNSGKIPADLRVLFRDIPCSYYPRNNIGYDIGAYQDLASKADVQMMGCFGESVYFHREGWLKRLAEAYESHGSGMYGLLSSYLVRPHLNTTAFACGPEFLRGWPTVIATRKQRYEFEHGEDCFWRRIKRTGSAVRFVTWDGEWEPHEWRTPDEILWRGQQSNLLAWCNHSDRYFLASDKIKRMWESAADGVKPEENKVGGNEVLAIL